MFDIIKLFPQLLYLCGRLSIFYEEFLHLMELLLLIWHDLHFPIVDSLDNIYGPNIG